MSGTLTGMPNMAGLYGLGMTGLQPEAMRRMMMAQQFGQGAANSNPTPPSAMGGMNHVAQGLLAAYLMGGGFQPSVGGSSSYMGAGP